MLFPLASFFFLIVGAQYPATPTFAPFAASFQMRIYGVSPDGPFVESVVGQQWWQPGKIKFSSNDYRGLARQLHIQVSPGHVNTTYVFFEEGDTRLSRCGPAPDNSSPYKNIPSGSFISDSGAAFLYFDTVDGHIATVWKGKGTSHLAFPTYQQDSQWLLWVTRDQPYKMLKFMATDNSDAGEINVVQNFLYDDTLDINHRTFLPLC